MQRNFSRFKSVSLKYLWLIVAAIAVGLPFFVRYLNRPRRPDWDRIEVKDMLRMNDATARHIVHWLHTVKTPEGGGVILLPEQYRDLSYSKQVGVNKRNGKLIIALMVERNTYCSVQKSAGFVYFEPGYPVTIQGDSNSDWVLQDEADSKGLFSGSIEHKLSNNLYYVLHTVGVCD